MDLSKLSDADLQALHQQASAKAINGIESSGAPDDSTVVNPKSGAFGSMQVMPATGTDPGFGVRPSDGSPEDTARMGRDYLAAMNKRYGNDTVAAGAYDWGPGNMDKWQANGGDMSKIPDETLKYMYNYNQRMGKQDLANVDSPSTPAPKTDLSKMSDDDLKKLYAQSQPSAAKTQALNFLNNTKQDIDNSVNALQGVGETFANQATGALDMGAGALAGGAQLLQGNGLDSAKQAFNQQQNVLTYNPRTPEGQQYTQKLGEGMDKYLMQPLEQGAVASLGAVPFIGQDLANNPTAQGYAKLAADVVGNVAPMLIGGHGVAEAAKGRPGTEVKSPGAAAELDKLNALNQGPEEFVGPPRDTTMGPNAGPQRGPISVDSQGTASLYGQEPTLEQVGAELGRQRQQAAEQQAAGDLFPDTLTDTTGHAEPFVSAETSELPTRDTQTGQLPLDDMSAHVDAFNEALRNGDPQGDLFSSVPDRSFDNRGPDETPRTLSRDEFEQTLENLSNTEGTGFNYPKDIPQFMDAVYDHYLETVSDAQGGLFDRPTIAENFAKSIDQAALERRVAEHPTVKAAQAKVDDLQRALDAAGDARTGSAPAVRSALEKAKDTLAKATNNIRNYFKDSAPRTTAEDGIVHMNLGIRPPDWLLNGIGRMLKAFHGIVFRALDRVLPDVKNMNKTSKIIAQGIKNKINEQATRKWDTQVNEKPKQVMQSVPGLKEGLKDYAPLDLPDDDLKAKAQQAPDLNPGDIKNWFRTQFLTGQQLAAFSKHPLVKFATQTVDRAFRNSAKFAREQLLGKGGLRDMARVMNDDEFGGIWHLMQLNEGKKLFSESELRRAGYSDKQVAFYKKFQEMGKEKLDALNRGRAAGGLPPVDARTAYIAGHFMGDFSRTIMNKDGKVVAVIAHNLRPAVEAITKRVMEQLGEGHTANPIEMRKRSEGRFNDRYLNYTNILNDFAGKDEVIAKVMDAYREYQTQAGQNAMKNRAAYKQKEGVIGAEGRKSWQDHVTNAREGMKNELRSQEAMTQWANMQDALQKIKKFTDDPEIDAPVAKSVVERYLKDVQGRDQGLLSNFVNSVVNGVAEKMGVGPTALRGMNNVAKQGLLTWFIGLGKLSHSFVTMIQPLQGIPVVSSLMRAEARASGSAAIPNTFGLHSAVAMMRAFGTQTKFLGALAGKTEGLSAFERGALNFAKDNDTFNTTQFQFGDLTDVGNKPRNQGVRIAKEAAEFNVTGMETATRSGTFMYYSHLLKDLSDRLPDGHPDKMTDNEIFQTAHNAMRDVMVDYNSWERPGVFGKLGFLGDLTAMLTRYKFNQIDQFARATKYAKTGDIGPMLTVMSSAFLAAGARGLMAYGLANAATQGLTTWAAKNGLMQKPTSLDELLLEALHGKNEHLADAVKFGLPAGLGINMTGSLSHADDIPNDPIGALLPQADPFGKYMQGIGQFLHDPNKATAKNMAYQLAPNSVRGLMENQMFTGPDGKYYNPQTGELVTQRSQADETKRAMGFRPLHEANEALTTEVNKNTQEDQGAVKKDLIQKLLREADSSNGRVSQDTWNKYANQYLANKGDPKDLVAALQDHQVYGKNLTNAQRAQGLAKGGLSSALGYERYQELK